MYAHGIMSDAYVGTPAVCTCDHVRRRDRIPGAGVCACVRACALWHVPGVTVDKHGRAHVPRASVKHGKSGGGRGRTFDGFPVELNKRIIAAVTSFKRVVNSVEDLRVRRTISDISYLLTNALHGVYCTTSQ